MINTTTLMSLSPIVCLLDKLVNSLKSPVYGLFNVILLGATLSVSHTANSQHEAISINKEMVETAQQFLNTLSAAERSKAQYSFDHEERLNWHFIPRQRNGLPLKAMNPEQLASAKRLLQTFLSGEGYDRSEAIRGLELVLAEIEVNGRFVRDPDLYYLTVFGEPSIAGSWAVRYEGHHQALNWTFVGGMGIASSPQFMGTNPAEVRSGDKKGLRVLGAEEDLARRLVVSLNDTQRKSAILDMDVPRDIFTAAQKQVQALDDEGLSYAAMTTNQQQNLFELIQLIASMQVDQVAEERLAQIKLAGLDAVKFVWIGGMDKGDAHYFRVQGVEFLIEYDNTQNDANHVHLVWRDFDGDFGRDLIRLHYDSIAGPEGKDHSH